MLPSHVDTMTTAEPPRAPGLFLGVSAAAWKRIGVYVVLAAAAGVPLIATDLQLFRFTNVLIYAIALLGLNILVGYNGQISLGHGAFYGIGAYVAAILVMHFAVPHWAAVPIAGFVCLLVGFAFGLPTLRLDGMSFAIATLALGAALPNIVRYKGIQQWTGGGQGLVLDTPEVPFGLSLSFDQWLYLFTLFLLALLFIVAANLLHGRIGRAIVAIRDHPIAAQAMGINTAYYKSATLGISAMYTGIAGALSAMALKYVAPGLFVVFLSFGFLIGIAVGGVASLSGAIYGAIFLQVILVVVGFTARTLRTGQVYLVYGVVVILSIYLMPGGVASLVERLQQRIRQRHNGPAAGIGTTSDGVLSETGILSAILVLALLLRIWNLELNGWGAEYYSAAVYSMAQSWHNFFFVAFDPAGFVSVDKPPISLWLQVASVKLFGFHPPSLLLPQVFEGVASVWVLFRIVRRRFSVSAALWSALLLALAPICVAVNRTNNTDSCLLLVLLLAAWALMKATETGSRRHLLVSMILIGIGFNVKMLAAFIVLPAFWLTYFVGAPLMWRRRVVDLILGGVVLVAVSVPWMLAVEWTPADQRPYVGSSAGNSAAELMIGHNGVGRFVNRLRPRAADINTPPASTPGNSADAAKAALASGAATSVVRLLVLTPTGLLRLFEGQLAAQAAWLLPLALITLVLGVRRENFRRPFNPTQITFIFWFSWMLIYTVVYSYAGGILHFYYLSTLAPAFAALAGIGIATMWRERHEPGWKAISIAAMLLFTVVWQLYVQATALGWDLSSVARPKGDDWYYWLHVVTACTAVLAVGLLLAARGARMNKNFAAPIRTGALAVGIGALLLLPTAWAMSTVLLPTHGVVPSADFYRFTVLSEPREAAAIRRFGRSADTRKLVDFLKTHHSGERYLLATSTTQLAAPLIISSGATILARGGFHGLDPILSPETFAELVDTKQVRFAMLGDVATSSRYIGADAAGQPITDWIRAHGKEVDPALWRGAGILGSAALYDLRPVEPTSR